METFWIKITFGSLWYLGYEGLDFEAYFNKDKRFYTVVTHLLRKGESYIVYKEHAEISQNNENKKTEEIRQHSEKEIQMSLF